MKFNHKLAKNLLFNHRKKTASLNFNCLNCPDDDHRIVSRKQLESTEIDFLRSRCWRWNKSHFERKVAEKIIKNKSFANVQESRLMMMTTMCGCVGRLVGCVRPNSVSGRVFGMRGSLSTATKILQPMFTSELLTYQKVTIAWWFVRLQLIDV